LYGPELAWRGTRRSGEGPAGPQLAPAAMEGRTAPITMRLALREKSIFAPENSGGSGCGEAGRPVSKPRLDRGAATRHRRREKQAGRGRPRPAKSQNWPAAGRL